MNEKINIIFQNENFLVVHKPSGVLAVPARFQEKDNRPCLIPSIINILNPDNEKYDEKHDGNNNKIKLYPVHRLDYEAQGLVLLAKNAKAHQIANNWFEKREIKKHYEAITEIKKPNHLKVDIDKLPTITMNHPALENLQISNYEKEYEHWVSFLLRGKKRAYEVEAKRGKKSLTNAILLGKIIINQQTYLYWHLMPLTGRSHQLRYEFYKRGIPILGDTLYGASIASQLSISLQSRHSIALHAFKLDFSNCENASQEMKLPSIITSATMLIDNYLLIT
ncbi:MAG: RNA pseudouridine synthase [Oligoflexia bacterium]|nr:RNA pseudouridine synthase [Oligoflexia bacterium]